MPSVVQAVAQAYRDLAAVFRVLSVPAAIACLVSGMGNILENALVADADYASRLLLEFLSNAGQQVLITPLLISAHRLIILGEAHNTYSLDISAPRFQRYIWISIALIFLNYLASYLAQFAVLLGASASMLNTIGYVQAFVFVSLLARVLVVFPAIAVDAEKPLSDALSNTTTPFWTTLLTVIASFILMFFVLAAVVSALTGGATAPQKPGIVENFVSGTAAIVMMTLLAVIGSRLYLSRGPRAAGA